MNDWNDYRPGQITPDPQPIEVRDYTVNGQAGPNTDPTPNAAPGPEERPRREAKQKLSKRMVALCLSCALLGGVGGGAIVGLTGGNSPEYSSGSTVLYEGTRPEVTLAPVSTERDKALTVPEIYANYADACVGISVDIVTTNYFGQTVKGAAAGSGFVVSEDGYIVTNYHVVENANAITVSFVDGEAYPASYIGGDAANDIAVLKIQAEGLVPVILGDSDNMHVGETVATIGNPLGELTFSLSDGVVSALDREITLSDGSKMNMLQTNCTINSGNSGGPLFNLYGEVIGIVSAKYSSSGSVFSSAEASVEGLGFAIPINDVKELITDLIEQGYISDRPYLGVTVKTVEESVRRYGIPAGAEILYATPGLAAAEAGLQEGDIITAVDGKPVDSNVALIDLNNNYKAGDTAEFTVYRQGQTVKVSVTYGEKTMEAEQAHTAYAAERDEAEAQQTPQNGTQQNPGQQPDGYEDFYDYYWPFF